MLIAENHIYKPAHFTKLSNAELHDPTLYQERREVETQRAMDNMAELTSIYLKARLREVSFARKIMPERNLIVMESWMS